MNCSLIFAAALASGALAADTRSPISPARMSATVKTLASDAFEGRAPDTRCYHQMCDAWSPIWDLRGAAADVDLFYRVALGLANSRQGPEWRATSELTAIRDASSAERP